MSTAAAFEDVHRDAEYFEYSKAADPIGLKLISRVPYHDFPASLYKDGPTRIIALDLSKELGVDYPATSADFGKAAQFQYQTECPGPGGPRSTYCDTVVR